MAKEIRLNAFEMNCVAHQSPGMWRHPRDRSRDYRRLNGWIELAQTLERGLFDGLFLADVLGVYDVFGGSPKSALLHATQTPVNDPLLLVPAMAAATQHLGFGVTVTLSYEPPFPFARRMSTLDHLTDGRIGWNVVTGYLDSAAKGSGQNRQRPHDERYAVAEDYMEVVYKLWEGSWADDAVIADVESGVFTQPERVRRVQHDGPHYKLDALHLSEPSPQRFGATPIPKGR
jgi:long-chain alkane monooxygenase